MSDDPAQRVPPDRKTQLEDEIIERAGEPYRGVLDEDEQAGMRIFLRLFVKTHPAMQSRVARRLAETAAPEDGQIPPATASSAEAGQSAVVTRASPAVGGETPPQHTDGSGVVTKKGAPRGAGGKVGRGR